MTDPSTRYNSGFFQAHKDGCLRSARVIIPMVLQRIEVRTAVDVGCGVGTWTAVLLSCGIDAIGLDGEYIKRSELLIPQERFLATDLRERVAFEKRFDLAVCLEVAEHLSESRAAGLVADLVRLSPCVLFSAAIPGQTGTDHVNEQYLSYWIKQFARFEYAVFDFIRPAVSGNTDVYWWYQQNVVVFAGLGHPLRDALVPGAMDAVHPRRFEQLVSQLQNPTVGRLISALPRSLVASVRRKLRGTPYL